MGVCSVGGNEDSVGGGMMAGKRQVRKPLALVRKYTMFAIFDVQHFFILSSSPVAESDRLVSRVLLVVMFNDVWMCLFVPPRTYSVSWP